MMLVCNNCDSLFEDEQGAGSPCPHCGGRATIPLPPISVTIKFAGPGSAIFGLDIEGQITPGQLAAAGQYLLMQAGLNWAMANLLEAIAEAVVRRLTGPPADEPQIAVPGMTPMAVREILKGIKVD